MTVRCGPDAAITLEPRYKFIPPPRRSSESSPSAHTAPGNPTGARLVRTSRHHHPRNRRSATHKITHAMIVIKVGCCAPWRTLARRGRSTSRADRRMLARWSSPARCLDATGRQAAAAGTAGSRRDRPTGTGPGCGWLARGRAYALPGRRYRTRNLAELLKVISKSCAPSPRLHQIGRASPPRDTEQPILCGTGSQAGRGRRRRRLKRHPCLARRPGAIQPGEGERSPGPAPVTGTVG
jgi:hypothetical protein